MKVLDQLEADEAKERQRLRDDHCAACDQLNGIAFDLATDNDVDAATVKDVLNRSGSTAKALKAQVESARDSLDTFDELAGYEDAREDRRAVAKAKAAAIKKHEAYLKEWPAKLNELEREAVASNKHFEKLIKTKDELQNRFPHLANEFDQFGSEFGDRIEFMELKNAFVAAMKAGA